MSIYEQIHSFYLINLQLFTLFYQCFLSDFLEWLLDSSIKQTHLLEPRNRIHSLFENGLAEQNSKLSLRIGDDNIRMLNKDLKIRISNNNDKTSNGTTDESN